MTTKKPKDAKREAMPDPLTEKDLVGQADDATAEPANKVVVYNPIEAGLEAMKAKHGHVLVKPPVVTAETYDTVKAARKEMVTFRTTLEKVRKAEKEASLRYGQLVDSEAKRIQAVATPIEAAYTEAIDTYEQAEQRRIDDIAARIKDIRETGGKAIGKPVDVLREVLEALNATDLSTFQELREQAAQAQEAALRDVRTLLAQAEEAERVRLEQEAERAEQARVQAIRLKIGAFDAALTQAALCRTSAMLQKLIDATAAITVDDSYQELQQEAADKKAAVLTELKRQHAAKVVAETEAEELAALRREKAEREAREAAAAAAAAPKPTEAPAQVAHGEVFQTVATTAPAPAFVSHEAVTYARVADSSVFVVAAGDRAGGTIVTETEAGSGIPGPAMDASGEVVHADVTTALSLEPSEATPSPDEIVALLCDVYDSDQETVLSVLIETDWRAVLANYRESQEGK